MLKFSIIFPTYGVEEYIKESIEDVLAQTYGEWELIIVDDCSPDKSGEIADSYAAEDSRITVIHRARNRGVGEARNLGLKNATGEYVLFLDPDDRFSHELLEKVESAINENDKPDAVLYSLREDYYQNGEIVYSKEHTHQTGQFEGFDEIYPAIIRLERETMYGYPWNKAFRRELIVQSDTKFKRIVHVEDILFNVDIFDHIESLVILEDILYYYRNQVASRDRRLTEKYMADYFRVQKVRVRRLLIQYNERRCALNARERSEALGVFAAEYYRSYLSMIERELSHGTSPAEVWRAAKAEQSSGLNRFLRRHLTGAGRAVKLLYRPLAEGCPAVSFAEVFAIIAVKRFSPKVYDRLKQAR